MRFVKVASTLVAVEAALEALANAATGLSS